MGSSRKHCSADSWATDYTQWNVGGILFDHWRERDRGEYGNYLYLLESEKIIESTGGENGRKGLGLNRRNNT